MGKKKKKGELARHSSAASSSSPSQETAVSVNEEFINNDSLFVTPPLSYLNKNFLGDLVHRLIGDLLRSIHPNFDANEVNTLYEIYYNYVAALEIKPCDDIKIEPSSLETIALLRCILALADILFDIEQTIQRENIQPQNQHSPDMAIFQKNRRIQNRLKSIRNNLYNIAHHTIRPALDRLIAIEISPATSIEAVEDCLDLLQRYNYLLEHIYEKNINNLQTFHNMILRIENFIRNIPSSMKKQPLIKEKVDNLNLLTKNYREDLFNRYHQDIDQREKIHLIIIKSEWLPGFANAMHSLNWLFSTNYTNYQESELEQWAKNSLSIEKLCNQADQKNKAYCRTFMTALFLLHNIGKQSFVADRSAIDESSWKFITQDIESIFDTASNSLAAELFYIISSRIIKIFSKFKAEIENISKEDLPKFKIRILQLDAVLSKFPEIQDEDLAIAHQALTDFVIEKKKQIRAPKDEVSSLPALAPEIVAKIEQELMRENDEVLAKQLEQEEIKKARQQQITAARKIKQWLTRQAKLEQENEQLEDEPEDVLDDQAYYQHEINILFVTALASSKKAQLNLSILCMKKAIDLARKINDKTKLAEAHFILCHYQCRQIFLQYNQQSTKLFLNRININSLPELLFRNDFILSENNKIPNNIKTYSAELPTPQTFIHHMEARFGSKTPAIQAELIQLLKHLRTKQHLVIEIAARAAELNQIHIQIQELFQLINHPPIQNAKNLTYIKNNLISLQNQLMQQVILIKKVLDVSEVEVKWRKALEQFLAVEYSNEIVIKKSEKTTVYRSPFAIYKSLNKIISHNSSGSDKKKAAVNVNQSIPLEELDDAAVEECLGDLVTQVNAIDVDDPILDIPLETEIEHITPQEDGYVLISHPALFELCRAIQQQNPHQEASPIYLVGGSVVKIVKAIAQQDPCVLSDNIEFDVVVNANRAQLAEHITNQFSSRESARAPRFSQHIPGLLVVELPLPQQTTSHDVLCRPEVVDLQQEAFNRDFTRSAVFLELCGVNEQTKECIFKIHEIIPGSINDIIHNYIRPVEGKLEQVLTTPQRVRRLIKALLQNNEFAEYEDERYFRNHAINILLKDGVENANNQIRQLIIGLYKEASDAFVSLKQYSHLSKTTKDTVLLETYKLKCLDAEKELKWLLPTNIHLSSDTSKNYILQQVRVNFLNVLIAYEFIQLDDDQAKALIAQDNYYYFSSQLIDFITIQNTTVECDQEVIAAEARVVEVIKSAQPATVATSVVLTDYYSSPKGFEEDELGGETSGTLPILSPPPLTSSLQFFTRPRAVSFPPVASYIAEQQRLKTKAQELAPLGNSSSKSYLDGVSVHPSTLLEPTNTSLAVKSPEEKRLFEEQHMLQEEIAELLNMDWQQPIINYRCSILYNFTLTQQIKSLFELVKNIPDLEIRLIQKLLEANWEEKANIEGKTKSLALVIAETGTLQVLLNTLLKHPDFRTQIESKVESMIQTIERDERAVDCLDLNPAVNINPSFSR